MRAFQSAIVAIIGIVCWIGSASPASAQATGTLLGTVKDSSGAIIAGARVTVQNQSTSISRATETNAEGTFILPRLPRVLWLYDAPGWPHLQQELRVCRYLFVQQWPPQPANG